MAKQNWDAEYCDVSMELQKSDLEQFLGKLVQSGASMHWREGQDGVILKVITAIDKQEFRFAQQAGKFILTGTYHLHDMGLIQAFQFTLFRARGCAVIKHFTEGPILISKITNGEAQSIMELNGPRKKVVYEKPIHVSSEDVIKAFKSQAIAKRIPVLRLELDYELVSLQDAIAAEDHVEMNRVKVRLEELRREMMIYEVFPQKIAGGTQPK
ncbi:hypothetical protein CIG75_04345 [Tumebacillus algifaecis]|uniref:Uncharacterized protein n=1 Tax=Tumebacillus algifaecis TaxID=1214604 RepID=A0A223CY18_9BACL|nr:hypothetical protein [Tumebacillus algifaecis]ASS74290.1 hypothetical protein CIG75_04345 [Tumebacillus algifaecis]